MPTLWLSLLPIPDIMDAIHSLTEAMYMALLFACHVCVGFSQAVKNRANGIILVVTRVASAPAMA